jgi:hypothetical protein
VKVGAIMNNTTNQTRSRRSNYYLLFLFAIIVGALEYYYCPSVGGRIINQLIELIGKALIVNFILPLLLAWFINVIANFFRKQRQRFSFILVWLIFLIAAGLTFYRCMS